MICHLEILTIEVNEGKRNLLEKLRLPLDHLNNDPDKTNENYDEIKKQFHKLFGNNSHYRLLMAKLELLQDTQALSFNPDDRELFKKVCFSEIVIADIMEKKNRKQQNQVEQILENQAKDLGKPLIKEDSQYDRIIKAVSFRAPQILLLMLYKIRVIEKFLKKFGSDISWSASWKTSIWTFAIHDLTSDLLDSRQEA